MKTMIALFLSLAASSAAQIIPVPPGGGNSYSGYLVAPSTLAYSQTFQIDMDNYKASRVSAQLVYSSATFANETFYDGQTCAGSITIPSTTSLVGTVLTVEGNALAAGTAFAINKTAVNGSSVTVANLKTVLVADFPLVTWTQTAQQSVVYGTSTVNSGSLCAFASSSYTLISTATTRAGISPEFVLGGTRISTANFFPTSEAVLYTAAGATIGGLTDQTTYYVTLPNTGALSLSTTAALAQANYPIVILSTTTQTATHTATLSALAWTSGASTLTWQSSNDGVNWITALSSAPVIGAISVSSATAGQDYGFDFGYFNYRYLRFNYAAPTNNGSLYFQIPVNVKQ